jgi:hypothetical protein
MMELLRLSESRATLVGGVAVDTVCVGTLVLLLLQPSLFTQGHAGIILLISLAITAPVLASAAIFLSFVLRGRFDLEERARRTLMSATVLHGGVQMSTLLGMFCGSGPATVASYFVSVWLLTIALAVSLWPLSWVLKQFRGQRRIASTDRPPPAKL